MRARTILLAMLAFGLYCQPASALLMQISNISDINLPDWNIGDGALSGHTDMCIYGIDLLGLTNYGITAQSDGGFKLVSGLNSIPYTLYWEDSGAGHLGTTLGTQLGNNVLLSNRHNHNILDANCNSGNNARLTVQITQADMTAALAGHYSGTVNLLLSPN